jgi:hypothetical protein
MKKLILIILIISNSVYAIPALPIWKEYKINNETYILKLKGNEHFSYFETKNGDKLKFHNNNFYKFTIENKKIIYSNSIYKPHYNNKLEINLNEKIQ